MISPPEYKIELFASSLAVRRLGRPVEETSRDPRRRHCHDPDAQSDVATGKHDVLLEVKKITPSFYLRREHAGKWIPIVLSVNLWENLSKWEQNLIKLDQT